MEDPDKIFLRTRVTRELHKEIKRAAVDDGISIEQVVGQAITEWIERRREAKPEGKDKEDLARFIRNLAEGTQPSEEECIFAAHEAGIDTKLALKLRDQLFTKPKNGISNH